ncbi:MAG: exonuclease SbcCD subunit D [Eubacteriales bacterium]|nr:exonuclease SbcCD subunit D [Eubacteriales bacterium]MDD4565926.1 exonuclease SbcCD subunit D [Eubacteriales bacterium]
MKLLHLSDLHIGKRVNEFSMLEDQEYILTKIINIIDEELPQGVLICGDVYDKSVPSAEAIALFDDFLVRLANRDLKIFVISGNHDSPERIAFGARLMSASGVYMSPVYSKDITPVTLMDKHGDINVYMLPFIKPAHVRASFPDEEILSYTDAVQIAIDHLNVDKDKRNILLAHQFVAGSERSDSEDISVGGSDNVTPSVFDDFDYVALGHIHKPQSITRETIRYCGTPLKYSFSESGHKKSVTVVDIGEKGNIGIRTVPLIPKRDMVEIKGTYMELTSKSYYDNLNIEDYYHVTLTDEEGVPDAMNKLRVIYKNIMKLDYDNKRTRSGAIINSTSDVETKSPLMLVSEFYELQNNQPISDDQKNFVYTLIEKIWEGEK